MTIIGSVKGDTRSVDYSSYATSGGFLARSRFSAAVSKSSTGSFKI